MSRDLRIVLGVTALLTAVGEGVMLRLPLFPVAAAEEAAIVDEAFRLMAVLAVPVFALVSTLLVYSALRFRRSGSAVEDGRPVHFHRPTGVAWLLATTALTLVLISIGVLGLDRLRLAAQLPPDLVVRVESMRWSWRITYPEKGVSTAQELVLPLGRRVRVEVTARDVVHSFWVPAFRTKIDAVPGMVTTVAFTPNRRGSFQDDPSFRLQCAELCGLGHTLMVIPVRVVGEEEFEQWLARQRLQR